MEYGAAEIIYTAMQTALLAGVRYWLYENNLRAPARLMYAVLAVISLGGAGVWLASGGINGLPYSYFRVLLAAIMFAVSCIVIREPFAKHALSYAFIMAYDVTLEGTANFVRAQLAPGADPIIYVIVSAAILAVSFVPCVRAIKRMIGSLMTIGNDRIWGQLCVICFSFLFMNLIFTFPSPGRIDLIILLSRYLMLAGIIGVYTAGTRVMRTIGESADARARLELTESRIAMQQSCYDRLTAQMEEVRRMRHDLRHHRAAISALIKNGDMEALSRYIDATAGAEEAVPVTGCLAADSVLLYYLDAGRALGAQIETDVVFSAPPPIADADLCVVLGNLLENAVEAQSYVRPALRRISVRARADEHDFTLSVENRFDGTLRMEAGAYISRKEEGAHGVGISSARAVCEKYDGLLRIETRADMFLAGVVIGI